MEKGRRMRKTLVTALAALLLLSSAASAAERTEEIVKGCVFPGWGQFSTGRYTRGAVMMGTALVSLGVIGGLTLQYNRHVDSYEAAKRGYSQATYIGDAEEYYSQMTKSWDDADNAYNYRNIALGVLAGMYIWSILDITLGPEAGTPPVAMELRPDGFMVVRTFSF
jgi:TM2 domain-containing membrane protein YozV